MKKIHDIISKCKEGAYIVSYSLRDAVEQSKKEWFDKKKKDDKFINDFFKNNRNNEKK